MSYDMNSVIKIAQSEIGYLEKRSNSQLDSKTANSGSNNYTKYWRDIADWGLGNYQAQYWCAGFLHWCFVKAYGLSAAKTLLLHAPYISCQTGYNLFKAKGMVYTSPKVGDIVVFWNGVRMNHTELVISVGSSSYQTIGGNTAAHSAVPNGGGVYGPKTYNIKSSVNKGDRFLRPNYGTQSSTPVVTPGNSSLIQSGSKGDEVRDIQTKLNKIGNYGLKVDGDFGPATLAAVKNFQSKYGLEVDGQVGSNTKTKLDQIYNSILNNGNIVYGSVGDNVKDLQTKLNVLNYGLTVDGSFGDSTLKAVKQFQTNNGLTVDGIAGPSTMNKLNNKVNTRLQEQSQSKPSTDDWVLRLQTELNKQYNSKLALDNIPGPNTLAACPLVKYGANGNITKLIQERLGNKFKIGVTGGYDGSFGNGTKAAVMELQRQYKLVIDGDVGKNTWKVLLGL